MYRIPFFGTLPTLVLLSALTIPVFGAEYFVSPTGSSSGNGNRTSPWSLATALAHPAAVRPGDTIWVFGGTYSGAFTNRLRGASGAPIIVRAYPGQRAILECDAYPASTYVLEVQGGYTWFWGLELRSTRQERGGERAGGINVLGPNIGHRVDLEVQSTIAVGRERHRRAEPVGLGIDAR